MPGPSLVLGNSAECLWRSWDDEAVVFDPATGDTHMLLAPSGSILEAVADAYPAPLSVVALSSLRGLDEPSSTLQDLIDLLVALDLITVV